MPAKRTLQTNHKRLSACTIAVLVCSGLLTSCTGNGRRPRLQTKQTTWTITYSPHSTSPYTVDYDYDVAHGGCQYATQIPTPPNPRNLVICSDDIVKWKGDSQGQKHKLVVYVPDSILTDAWGVSVNDFNGSDNQPTKLGHANGRDATLNSTHEWFVVLFDKQNTHSTCDDPKIKIGT